MSKQKLDISRLTTKTGYPIYDNIRKLNKNNDIEKYVIEDYDKIGAITSEFILSYLCELKNDTTGMDEHLDTALNNESADKIYNNGYHYTHNEGPKIGEKVIKIYNKAISKGSIPAYYGLGHLYQIGTILQQNLIKSIEYYEKAIEHGSAKAMNDLGMIYMKGGKDVYMDRKKAFDLFHQSYNIFCDDNKKKSEKSGSELGAYNYARCLMKGKGCDINLRESVNIFIRLLELGVNTDWVSEKLQKIYDTSNDKRMNKKIAKALEQRMIEMYEYNTPSE